MSTFFIVGASSGIGLQLARNLANEGHQVYGTYQQNARESGNGIQYQHLNVLDDGINVDFLPDNIDGVVYCPGSITLKPFHRIAPQDFESDYRLNVLGAIKVVQAVLPKLKQGNNPSVVLFSTVAVQTGLVFHTQVAASKGAIEGLTRALAAELSPRIRVNCVAPSLTDTPLAGSLLNSNEKKEASAQRHPLKRIGSAKDIANAAQFLLSDNASWITGQVIAVDGGLSSLKI